MDRIERTRLRSLIGTSLEGCTSCWRPAVDVYREPDGWLCKFDLAGVARDDFEVHVRGGRLCVAGVRRDRTLCDGRQAWSLEIAYHAFERTIELPCELCDCRIDCTLDGGMLLVSIREGGR